MTEVTLGAGGRLRAAMRIARRPGVRMSAATRMNFRRGALRDCPTCGAAVGERCRTTVGAPAARVHMPRLSPVEEREEGAPTEPPARRLSDYPLLRLHPGPGAGQSFGP